MHCGNGLLFRYIVLPRVPDQSFQFLTQHTIQRRPTLCRDHFACLDQVLIKADGNILFHGKTSFVARDLRVTRQKKKNQQGKPRENFR